MSIWSECIYVYPANQIVDLSLIDRNLLENLSHSGFFIKYLEENGPSKLTLEEIKNECFKKAKIYGYMDDKELKSWDNLLYSLSLQIPGQNIEFHFFCSHEQLPYYFIYDFYTNTTYYYEGYKFHVAYFDVDEQGEYIKTLFNTEKYIQKYKKLHFNDWNYSYSIYTQIIINNIK